MKLTVNGEPTLIDLPKGAELTVAGLLARLGLPGPVAVERNGDVVPRREHTVAVLADGDVVEIVHFVGGG